MQDDPAAFRVDLVGISPQPLHEQRRIGLAEAIDRLFHVADHEHHVVVIVDCLQDRVLDLAHILAFVHENVVIFSLHLGPQRRVGEHLHSELLHVREVDQVFFRLFCQKCSVGRLRQSGQTPQMPLHHGHFPVDLLSVEGQIGLDLFDHLADLLALLGDALAPFLFRFRQAADDLRLHQRKAVQRGEQLVHVHMFHVKQFFTGHLVRREGLPACFHRICLGEHVPHGLQDRRDALELQFGLRQQYLHPGMGGKISRFDRFDGLIQPLKGAGQRH